MAQIDRTYKELLETILEKGFWYNDPNRKGVKRLQIDDYRIVHNFSDGFPAITTRKTYFNLAVAELLVFLSGAKNLKELRDKGINFWNQDTYNFYLKHFNERNVKPQSYENFLEAVDKDGLNGYNYVLKLGLGRLGKIYPYQMRNWNGKIDQLLDLIYTLRNNPMATKKTVTMWNPSDLEDSALSPCHFMFQAIVSKIGKNEYGLKIKFSMHSVDTFLGLPSNLQYYSTLCYILAAFSGMKSLGIIADLTNVHLYDNQIDAVKEQLKRDVDKYDNSEIRFSENFYYMIDKFLGAKEDLMTDPQNKWNESEALTNVFKNLSVDDFILKGYESYEKISVPMLSYNK